MTTTWPSQLSKLATITTAAAPTLGKQNSYNATAGALAPVLPPLTTGAVATALAAGQVVRVKVSKSKADTSTNAVTLTCTGGDTFEGGTTTMVLLAAGEKVTLQAGTIPGGSGPTWNVEEHTAPRDVLDGRYTLLAPAPSGDGTGVTDRTALQALHDALPAWGGRIELQQNNALGGGYVLDVALAVSKPVKMTGLGGALLNDASITPVRTVTTIQTASRTANCITVTAPGCTFEDFAVVNTAVSAPTAGAGISVATGQVTMRGVTISGFYNDLAIDNPWLSFFDQCRFLDPVNYGVFQTSSNSAYYDHADSGFTNCVWAMINRQTDAAAAYRWEGGGGVKLTGCKTVGQGEPGSGGLGTTGAWMVGVDLAAADGVATGEFTVTGGGLSNCKTACFRAAPKGTTGTFSRIVISGVILQGFGGANTTVGVLLTGGASSNSVSNAIISGCVFAALSGGCITAQAVTGLHVGPNMILNCPSYVTLSGGVDSTGNNTRSVEIAPPTFGQVGGTIQTACNIVVDNRNVLDSNSHGLGSSLPKLTVPVNLSSVGTWVTVASFTVVRGGGAGHGAARIAIDFGGHDSGNNAFGFHMERGFDGNGLTGVIAKTTLGTDQAWGYVSPHYGIQFDGSTAGQINIQMQLTTGGTQVGGELTLEPRGVMGKWAFGALV